MRGNWTSKQLTLGWAALVLACGDSTGTQRAVGLAAAAGQSQHAMHLSSAIVTPQSVTPFTVRATLDPFKIQQLPDFMMQSNGIKDIVMQQAVFTPGAGPWHTHPGPSFIYVLQGQIKLERHIDGNICRETQVFVPGQAYFEVGNQVHRAVVVSSDDAVLLVTRFNVPVGAPFTIPAADPGCTRHLPPQ